MRKYLAMLLAAVMLLTMMPLGAAAAETDTSERDELIALACEVFPEYADFIQGKQMSAYTQSRDVGENEIIFCETRSVSESEKVTLAQYANGRGVIVTESGSAFDLEETGSNTSGFSGGTTWYLSYKVTVIAEETDVLDYYGVFSLDNLVVKIYNSSYDCIYNDGSASVNSTTHCRFNKDGSDVNRYETASDSGKLNYYLTFLPSNAYGVVNSNAIYASLRFRVSGNNIYVELAG